MSGSEQPKSFFPLSKFSHIYVESDARAYPLASDILTRFSKATIVEIHHYQQLFNRVRQNWREQKAVQKLFLAKREGEFLYPRTEMIQDAGVERFFYTTPILNCVYDCDYCFLQGKFRSAHAVIFVNIEDFFNAVDKELQNGPLTLSPSYETDLLGFEGIVPWTRAWIEFARTRPNVTLELRTKSSSFRLVADLTPVPNVILAWTLSPTSIAENHERKTPGLEARVMAVKEALQAGWKVRLCFDPLLVVANWKEVYSDFLQLLATEISFKKLYDIWIGPFRMNQDFLKNIQAQRTDSEILFFPWVNEKNVSSYSSKLQQELLHFVNEKLNHLVQAKQIVRWHP
jgi:spore photoproduct lyase